MDTIIEEIKKYTGFLITLIFVLLGTGGAVGGFLSYTTVEYGKPLLFCGVFFLCVWFTLLFDQNFCRHTCLGLIATVLLVLFWIIWKREAVGNGFLSIGQSLLDSFNENYHTNLVLNILFSPGADSTTLALLVFAAVVSLLLSFCLVYGAGKWIAGLLFILVLAGGLVLNTVPSLVSVAAMLLSLISGIAESAGYGREPDFLQKKSGLIMAVITVGILLGAGILETMCAHSLHGINQRMQTYMDQEIWPKVSKFDEFFASSGGQEAFNGNLNKNGSFSYSGIRTLQVTVSEKPKETLYLKGYVGEQYTGSDWTAVDDQQLSNYAVSQGWSNVESLDQNIANLSYETAHAVYEEDGEEKSQQITVDRVTASADYTYYPYGAFLDRDVAVQGDGAVAGMDATVWSSSFYPWSQAFYEKNKIPDSYLYSAWGDLQKGYEQYVRTYDLEVPEEKLPRLWQQCSENQFSTEEEVISYVKGYLKEAATYTMNPSPIPEDQDFAEYFLYENREGYCVHFATAAVLMFRMEGLPARYVEGYVAPADTFEKNDQGTYTADVTDQRAHAWAEVYLADYGWVPIETTPPYAGREIASTKDQQEEPNYGSIYEELDTVTPKPTQQAQATPTAETSVDRTQQTSTERKTSFIRKPVIWVGILLLGMLVCLVCWRMLRIWYNHRRIKRLRPETIHFLFERTHEVLIACGISPNQSTLSSEFLKEVEAKCPSIQPEELKNYLEIACKASFSDLPVTRREISEARRMYQKINGCLYPQMTFWQKIKFRWLKVYF